MTDFNIAEAAIPATTRATKPNPFTPHFPTAEGKALSIELDGDKDNNKVVKDQVTAITGQARRAADALEPPMTARVHSVVEGTGKNAKTIVSIWTVEKQRRPRNADGNASASK